MAEMDVPEIVPPMIITPAHKHQPMNKDRLSIVTGLEDVKWTGKKFCRILHKILVT